PVERAVPSFYAHSARPPRDTHSLPTRRSSDLNNDYEAQRVVYNPEEQMKAANLRRQMQHLETGLRHTAPDWRCCICRRRLAAFIDRKSTRLNSSHRTTSYAVFCLKKKKRLRVG